MFAHPGPAALNTASARGPCKRQERAVGDLLDVAARHPGAHVRDIGFLAGGVDHNKQMIVPMREHQIIVDPARLVGKDPVALTPVSEPKDIDRHKRLEVSAAAS